MPNDGPDGLSKATTPKEVEDYLETTCKKPFRKLSNDLKLACLNFKTNKDLQADLVIKGIRIEEIDNKLNASTLISERVNQYQTIGAHTFMAVVSASEKYELILKTRASQSVGKTFLIDLLSSFLPVIKPLENVVGRFIGKIPLKADIEWVGSTMVAIPDFGLHDNLTKVVNALDSVSDNVSQAVLHAKDGLDLTAESQQLLNSYTAKNAVLQSALESIAAELARVTKMAALIYQQAVLLAPQFAANDIANFRSFIDKLLSTEAIGLKDVADAIDVEKFKILGQFFLQKMLKSYVSNNVVITGSYDVIVGLPGTIGSATITGMDSAQRQMMYDFLKPYNQHFSSSDLVSSDKDLYPGWTTNKSIPPSTNQGYSPSRAY